ncbi:hypothetical protein COCOBI_03-3140 [Coccomyxa sp. Obi]|nr:hypothetical protein COCOBI_03-3140 [Coccomyxa sp. Obi]
MNASRVDSAMNTCVSAAIRTELHWCVSGNWEGLRVSACFEEVGCYRSTSGSLWWHVGGNWEGMGHRLREHLGQPVVASDPGAQMRPATGGAVPL